MLLSAAEKWERHKARCRAYYKANKVRLLAMTYAKRKANPEERKRHDATYRARNAEKVKASKEAYRLANLEKVMAAKTRWRVENPEKMQAARAAWERCNPEKKQVHRENRRARERNAAGKLSTGLTEDLLRQQAGKCAACSAFLVGAFELDHIMPLWLGGANDDVNIQILCRPCNRRKGRKHPTDFMRSEAMR